MARSKSTFLGDSKGPMPRPTAPGPFAIYVGCHRGKTSSYATPTSAASSARSRSARVCPHFRAFSSNASRTETSTRPEMTAVGSFEIGGLPKRTVRPAGQQSVSYARAVSSSSPGANPISRSASFASIVHPSLPQRHTQLMEKSLRRRRHGVKSNKFLPAHRALRDFNHAARLIDSSDQIIRFAIIPISSCARKRIVPRMGNVLFAQTVPESMGMDAS